MTSTKTTGETMAPTEGPTRARTDLCIVLPSLEGGGAERVMVTLANEISRRGFVVDIAAPNATGPYLREVSDTVRIVDFGAKRAISALPTLVRYLRRENPKAVLSALTHMNIMTIWARRLAGSQVRLVVSERSHLSTTLNNEAGLKYRIVPPLVRATYGSADGVVAVSEGVAMDLRAISGLPASHITTIYNPLDRESIAASSREPLSDDAFEQDDRPFVVTAGRLTPQKDHTTLLKAFARLRDKMDIRLVILGKGPEEDRLRIMIAELGLEHHVVMKGFVANPFAWMKRASLFVLSSRYEGLPGALMQAMACGTPVVSTDCPSGPSEILEGGKWGELVEVGDDATLSEAMYRTLSNTNRPDVLKRAADFSLDRATDRYLSALGFAP